MDIKTLCENINLPTYSYNMVVKYLKENNNYQNIDLNQLRIIDYDFTNLFKEINNDDECFKILALQLLCAVDTYKYYQEKQISDEIYFATMKCFTRFINECKEITNIEAFDRHWWVARQLNMKLFRIGELEYEILENAISIHIPSDANLALTNISLLEAKEFFKKYYPDTKDFPYICSSWLLGKELKDYLPKDSKILYFQSFFKIDSYYENVNDYLLWVFKCKNTHIDYKMLKEATSLQKALKKHLLEGKTLTIGNGKIC